MSEILTSIYKYQTIVVGLIGFAGVIATLLTNAKIARGHRQADLINERNSIRQGLLTELNSLNDTYKDRARSDGRDKDWLIPVRVTDNFYQAMLPQLGKLSIDEIGPVMKAYQLVSEMPTRLTLLSPVPLGAKPEDGYIQIDRRHVDHVKKMHLVFVEEIDKATGILKEKLDSER